MLLVQLQVLYYHSWVLSVTATIEGVMFDWPRRG